MNSTHWIVLGLFSLFQIFSIGTFLSNVIKNKQDDLNFVPSFFLFCLFLYFGVLNSYLTLLESVIYLILLIIFNIGLNTLNYHITKSKQSDDN